VLGYQAVTIATGSGGGGGSSEDSLTARLMNMTGGQLLVGALGLAIIGVGVALAVKGVTCKFTKDLQPEATSGKTGGTVLTLGQLGYVAKGISLAVIGGLFVWAAATHDAGKAGGLDEALKTLLERGPVGPTPATEPDQPRLSARRRRWTSTPAWSEGSSVGTVRVTSSGPPPMTVASRASRPAGS
jgi:hypothetical protein